MNQKTKLRERAIERAILQGAITRRELTSGTTDRLATVGEAVRSLLDEGMLEEPERVGKSSNGRRASPLRLRADFGAFLGVSLSPGGLRAVLVDASGKSIASTASEPVSGSTTEEVLRMICRLTEEISSRSAPPVKILAAGFADPGLVDEKRGISIKAVNLPGWSDVATAEVLGKHLGCRVFVFPEMAARAYAERLLEGNGSAEGWLHLNVSEGVGSAYTRGLEAFVGDSSCQMEIGHLVVEEDGALCSCGNRGCLEAYAGREGIQRRVHQLTTMAVRSRLVEAPYSTSHFVECARAGDRAAVRLAMETARYLGRAIAACVCLLNPAQIRLSGTLFSLDEILLPEIGQEVSLHCLPQAVDGLEWRISTLGEEAAAVGAALRARHTTLSALA